MDDPCGVLQALRTIGALKSGHFLLSSGRHSDQYVEKFDLLRRPQATSAACANIVEHFRAAAVDLVVGPTTGGVILAFETARQLGADAAYAERKASGEPGREFRRGTTFSAGARILVVDDILTTGGSIMETLAALTAYPVVLAGIAVLVDRSGGRVPFDAPYFAIAKLDIATWNPTECPLCAHGLPLLKPGTTPEPAPTDAG